ncbi:MAG: hypothetical protein N2Z72_07405 [Bacteroidales bacterium]|nr:hypothetical protein [Bacteroidales bacterium]
MRYFRSLVILLVLYEAMYAQSYGSRSGYYLPVHGRLRVLVVFVELKYPSGKEPNSIEFSESWQPGKLPIWSNELFDPFPMQKPQGWVTSYFHEASFGEFEVLGDVWEEEGKPGIPILLPSDGSIDPIKILEYIGKRSFRTKHLLSEDSFDLWFIERGGEIKRRRQSSDKLRLDHLMIIVRNSTYPAHGAGYASTFGLRGGNLEADSYSVFCTHGSMPLGILLHEFNHLLLGGNNMHCCGGNHAASGPQYFLSFQAGWGMMGAANRILMTVNGWDRYKLGWKSPYKKFYISCLNEKGEEICTDFTALEQFYLDTTLILRDFITTGDVIRVRLPYLSSDEYPQWLWLENHQTTTFNGSRFDRFQYEDAYCIDKARPGIYAYIQVAHEDTLAPGAFRDFADFIRVVPASGFYDLIFEDTLVQNNWCINNVKYYPFVRSSKNSNPFTGYSVHELVGFDENKDGKLQEKEKRTLGIEKLDGQYRNNLPYLGETSMAFVPGDVISISTNPALVNMLTYLNDDRSLNGGKKPDNRIIYLHGIRIYIYDGDPNYPGSLRLRIVSHVPEVNYSTRWAAPHIILPKQHVASPYDLIIRKKVRLVIDRSMTPTTDTMFSKKYWNPPTTLIFSSGTKILMEKGSKIILKNDSRLVIEKGVDIRREKRARIVTHSGGRLIFEK